MEGNFSRAYTGLGRYQQALEHGERGLALRRRAGDIVGEPAALHHVAQALHGLGEHHKAIDLCHEAINLGRTVGFLTKNVAEPLDTLATVLHHTGHTEDATICWREAAALFDECGSNHRATQIRQRLHTVLTGMEFDDERR